MKKVIMTTMVFCLIGQVIFSQNQTAIVTGKVTNDKNEPIPFVTIKVKNGKEGAQTDTQGKFSIKVTSLPVMLQITSTGYDDKEVSAANADELNVILSPNEKTLEEVIVNAGGDARLKVKQLEAPFDYLIQTKKDFNNSPSDPYASLLTKRGLDVTVSSITYKTYSTRGFNGSGSSRVNQIMDGMDNQAPGLNFTVGNFVGLSDLDLESIEILPGASSALYGPGGLNGTIILNSKNPFKTPGFSLLVKNGVTDIGKEQRNKAGLYSDYTLRWAKNFNDRFAFKIGAQYTEANDWLANDTTNYLRMGGSGTVVDGTRQTDPNYDGVNVYGDETNTNIKRVAEQMVALGILPAGALPLVPEQVTSRTGYNEIDVI